MAFACIPNRIMSLLVFVLMVSASSDHCETRISPEECSRCCFGWWGRQCQKSCIHCGTDGCDINSGVCRTCEHGLYGQSCDQSCPELCAKHGTKVICNKTTGHCTNGCNDSWWGPTCNQSCSSNCHKLQCRHNSGTCMKCRDGWHGHKCDEKCPRNCKENTCNQYTGRCIGNCTFGFFGGTCNDTCKLTNCVDDACEPDFQTKFPVCAKGCVDGWAGDNCTLKCPDGCSVCDRSTRECKTCENGLFGSDCTSECSETCVSITCSMNGTCHNGCVLGFYGTNCSSVCDVNCLECDRNGVCLECKIDWTGVECTESSPLYQDAFVLGNASRATEQGRFTFQLTIISVFVFTVLQKYITM